MAEIVNLRMARKAQKREAGQKEAAQNRAKFGQPASARATQEAELRRTSAILDGAKLERD